MLTEEQIAQERAFMQGLPPLNIAALFLPPIWGPAHGFWITILYYPLWLFADNSFYAAFSQRTTLSIVAAVIVGLILTIVTVVFARLSQPAAAHKYIEQKGMPRETYIRRQKIWGVVSVLIGVAMIAFATYYNLVIRPGLTLG